MSAKSWYGKIFYEGEGVLFEEKFTTEAEADAFVLGFKRAGEICLEDDNDPLDGYGACTDTEPAGADIKTERGEG